MIVMLLFLGCKMQLLFSSYQLCGCHLLCGFSLVVIWLLCGFFLWL